MLDVAEVHNKIEKVKEPPVALEDKTIPVIAVSDNVHCPNIPPNATKYIGKYSKIALERALWHCMGPISHAFSKCVTPKNTPSKRPPFLRTFEVKVFALTEFDCNSDNLGFLPA